ncbi:hypothetical protein [Hymenobacter sp. BT559]|uniref:hypothetical protein n=1 Tax=Hymenobacter sp. BT559 TaxID=2795729 RepID=UPI0018EA52E9|nr:hypothetical protein [Hymenobacter sp. BT559]MBJ6146334.1 hypothetical protein [Hymenobacter sp. BT559]
MSVSLFDTSASKLIPLVIDSSRPNDDGSGTIFIMKSSDGILANVIFKPTLNSKFSFANINPENFEIILLDNPYFNAESDVFEVHESTVNNDKIGWIFPISYIDSDETDELSLKSTVDLYKASSFINLLKYEGAGMKFPAINSPQMDNVNYNISQFFGDNLIILAIHKETINKIKGFKMSDYMLSLFKLGYSKYGEKSVIYNSNKKLLTENLKKTKKITLSKSKFDISKNLFVETVFYNYLNYTDNSYLRFVFIYQVIELLMDFQKEMKFNEYLDKYKSGSIHGNDFREKLSEYSKERKVIGQVIASSLRKKTDYVDFLQLCNEYIIKNGGQIADDLSDSIYNLRNLLTHNFRRVAEKMEELDTVVVGLEFIIVEMLIDYNFSDTNTWCYEI